MNSNIPVDFLPCSVQNTHILCLLLCYIKESWFIFPLFPCLQWPSVCFHLLLLSFVLFLRLNSQPYKGGGLTLIFLYSLSRVFTACILAVLFLATELWMADELFSNCILSCSYVVLSSVRDFKPCAFASKFKSLCFWVRLPFAVVSPGNCCFYWNVG